MQARFEKLTRKQVIGVRKRMSFAEDLTPALWQAFMPGRKEIANALTSNLYSIEQYDSPQFLDNFNPRATYTKWAAVEVSDLSFIPNGMEAMTIPAGDYAVFVHRGPASLARQTYQYIFETWLPSAEVNLDHRPHFAVMDEHYRADDPNATEEIWIPVKAR
ncbi:AraC family transcriptional regulator [Segetibacter sp. 3557_3]|uniref:GyrI-like domain-containing protein n=1 Tax=Segetibacter sp. 3557_3 TaxID=2547429 RepID=UPI0010585C1E|nr:GyrI-like domain-containing protein [Segetibacter sp. 3557_3]TDH21644.1 AraC family transcriptional regulator [Segetibacter sp. 3557_3]